MRKQVPPESLDGPAVDLSRAFGRGAGGFALVEVLAAMLLLSVAIGAVFMTLLAVFTSSAMNRNIVLSGNEATKVVESIQRAAYEPCPSASNYSSALPTTPKMTLSVTKVEYIVSSVSDSGSFQASCPGTGDKGVQRVTVTARATARPGGSETLVIFKRNDTCPGSPTPGKRC